jgi:hypothetical protein
LHRGGGFSGGLAAKWPRVISGLPAIFPDKCHQAMMTFRVSNGSNTPFTTDQPIEKAHTEISVNICQYLSISPEVVG